MKLTMIETKDFWEFYEANKSDLDKIIWHTCQKHAASEDPDEMKTQLLLRLHKSNMLKEFDPAKASLNTYVTTRVNGYALHIITALKKKATYIKGDRKPYVKTNWAKEILSVKKVPKHKVNKKRTLTDNEKALIRNEFIACKGIITEDTCVAIKAKLPADVSIFQITGCVTGLHRQVKNGKLMSCMALVPEDLKAYVDSITSHREHWKTYKSSKYIAMRSVVEEPHAYFQQVMLDDFNSIKNNTDEEGNSCRNNATIYELYESSTLDDNLDVEKLFTLLKKNLSEVRIKVLHLVYQGYDFETIAKSLNLKTTYVQTQWAAIKATARKILGEIAYVPEEKLDMEYDLNSNLM